MLSFMISFAVDPLMTCLHHVVSGFFYSRKVCMNIVKFENFKSGIYFLYKDGELLYIGQTRLGLKRVFSHIEIDFNEYSFMEFDVELIDEKESEYITSMMPKLNKQARACPLTIKSIVKKLKEKYKRKRIFKRHIENIAFENNILIVNSFGLDSFINKREYDIVFNLAEVFYAGR